MSNLKLLISLVFICGSVVASDKTMLVDYINENVEEIYWMTSDNDNAVVYAKWPAFKELKSFLNNTVDYNNVLQNYDADLRRAHQLLLADKERNILLNLYLTEDALILDGKAYEIDKVKLIGFVNHNKKRISVGDPGPIRKLGIPKLEEYIGGAEGE